MYEKGQYIVYGIRGVCKVTDIITIDHPVGPKGRLYYELRPCNQKDGRSRDTG
ncbi:MAG: CarD family transcriptional regulator [Enterocloster sp.]